MTRARLVYHDLAAHGLELVDLPVWLFVCLGVAALFLAFLIAIPQPPTTTRRRAP